MVIFIKIDHLKKDELNNQIAELVLDEGPRVYVIMIL